jgi:hypothetical protein
MMNYLQLVTAAGTVFGNCFAVGRSPIGVIADVCDSSNGAFVAAAVAAIDAAHRVYDDRRGRFCGVINSVFAER